MENIEYLPVEGVSWALAIANRVANEVKRVRKARKMTVQQLADRTAEIGHPLTRLVITKLETGRRGEHLQVADVLALAWALNVPPVSLLFPALPDGEVELVPGVRHTSITAATWFSGETTFEPNLSEPGWLDKPEAERMADVELVNSIYEGVRLVRLSREQIKTRAEIEGLANTVAYLRNAGHDGAATELASEIAARQAYLASIEQELRTTPGAVVNDGR